MYADIRRAVVVHVKGGGGAVSVLQWMWVWVKRVSEQTRRLGVTHSLAREGTHVSRALHGR